ncbi:DUF7282 domain-containing protein [Halobacterium hubeiense]|uniref:DUF7282 domain-containing protein n=1 Tax=Halobacterium hubeiense TaxID=1407499 RepID=UPI000B7F44F8|nr:hypothetical protein [Halobacterium hubeiense]
MTDMHDLRVSARTAELLASDSDDDGGPPWRFSGVAVAAGDILHMDDGTPVLFAEEELRAAAETQTGEPLTVDHPSDEDGRPQYPPPTDETVGKVPKAGWVEDVQGVAYEATTHDQTIANGVQSNSYEVSVHPTFELGAQDPETGAYKAKNIRFRDLSVVSKGDSPNNTVEWGPNEALASFTHSTDIGEELTAAEDVDDGDTRSLIRRLAERAGLLESSDFRGGVRFPDQTTDGDTVTLDDAGFEDAPWLVTLHAPGEEFPDAGEGLGPALGASAPQDAGDYETDVDVELDEPLEDDQTLFALLRYHADGEVSDPIPTSDGGYYLDSAFVGVAPDGVDVEATAAASGNEPAESGVDSTDSDMSNPNDPEDPEDPEAQTDPDSGDADGETTLDDMTVDELGDALREQGFVTEDQADQLVEQATAQAEKEEKVDEIVAKSDDYDEDDREALLASADTLIDREHQRVRGELAAEMPANGGAAQLTGGAGDENVDEYGTGVKED